MNVYFAARYSRHPEMRSFADELALVPARPLTGHDKLVGGVDPRCYIVVSRWINGEHEMVDGCSTPEQSRAFALEDLADLARASIVICFTEGEKGEGRARGGRHVEFGLALARRLGNEAKLQAGAQPLPHILVVGPAENVFYHHPVVKRFETWGECLSYLEGKAEGGW